MANKYMNIFLSISKLKMYWNYTLVKLITAEGSFNQIFITALNIRGENMFNNDL